MALVDIFMACMAIISHGFSFAHRFCRQESWDALTLYSSLAQSELLQGAAERKRPRETRAEAFPQMEAREFGHGKIKGKSWENQWKINGKLENQWNIKGTSRGNKWKIHGKLTEKRGKIMGKYWEYGNIIDGKYHGKIKGKSWPIMAFHSSSHEHNLVGFHSPVGWWLVLAGFTIQDEAWIIEDYQDPLSWL